MTEKVDVNEIQNKSEYVGPNVLNIVAAVGHQDTFAFNAFPHDSSRLHPLLLAGNLSEGNNFVERGNTPGSFTAPESEEHRPSTRTTDSETGSRSVDLPTDQNGNKTTITTDQNGHATIITTDQNGTKTAVTADQGTKTTVITDQTGNTTTKHDYRGQGSDERTVDGQGRETHRKFSSDSKTEETTTTYDQDGRFHSVTHGKLSASDGDVTAQTEYGTTMDQTKNGWTKTESLDGKTISATVHQNTADGYIETTTNSDGSKATTQRHYANGGWSEDTTTVDAQGKSSSSHRTSADPNPADRSL